MTFVTLYVSALWRLHCWRASQALTASWLAQSRSGIPGRVPASGASVGGAYLSIENLGQNPIRLLGARTPIAQRVEIHEMSMTGGVMRMRPMPGGLIVPPGAKCNYARRATPDARRPGEATCGRENSMTLLFSRVGPRSTSNFTFRSGHRTGTKVAAERLDDHAAAFRPKIMSLAFSAIMIVGALVLPDTSRGMIEASITRRPSMPCTRSCAIDDRARSVPHLARADRVIDRGAGCARSRGAPRPWCAVPGINPLACRAEARAGSRSCVPTEARDDHFPVERIAEIVRLNRGIDRRVRRLDADPSPALGAHLAWRDRETGRLLKLHAPWAASFSASIVAGRM